MYIAYTCVHVTSVNLPLFHKSLSSVGEPFVIGGVFLSILDIAWKVGKERERKGEREGERERGGRERGGRKRERREGERIKGEGEREGG